MEGKYQSKGKLGIEVGRVFDDNGLCEIVKNKEGNYFVWFSGQTYVSIYELQIGELIIDKVKSNEFNFYEKLTFGSNIKAAYCGDNNFFVYGFQQDKKTKSNRKNSVTKISIDSFF